jgi:hypothetical protein
MTTSPSKQSEEEKRAGPRTLSLRHLNKDGTPSASALSS